MNAVAGTVRAAERRDRAEWLRMRTALWPDDHEAEVEDYFAGALSSIAVFVAERPGGRLCGFAEVGLRSYAEGCRSSPVGYLEGIWVDDDVRGRGIGRALVARCERWAIERGCVEFGSDAVIDNVNSHAFHRALGFEQVLGIVCFRRSLAERAGDEAAPMSPGTGDSP